MSLSIENGWLVESLDHCTCNPYYGAHEAICGKEPLQRLDHLPGWDDVIRDSVGEGYVLDVDAVRCRDEAAAQSRSDGYAAGLQDAEEAVRAALGADGRNLYAELTALAAIRALKEKR